MNQREKLGLTFIIIGFSIPYDGSFLGNLLKIIGMIGIMIFMFANKEDCAK